MWEPQLFPAVVVILASIAAAASDLRRLRVYNVLTLPLILGGVIYHVWLRGSVGFVDCLLGITISGGMMLIPYLLGGIGAGDVKLVAGVGAWLGVPVTVCVLVASSLAAGVYAVVLLLRYGGVQGTVQSFQILYYKVKALGNHIGPEENIEAILNSPDRYRRVVPFGAMVAIGVLVVIWWLERWI